MARDGTRARRQVQLTVFDNEPEARMAEQLLLQEGIPSVTKSLGGGPGLWGSAFNLPHGVYVHEGNAERAREILGLEADDESAAQESNATQSHWLWIAIVILLALALILAGSTLQRLLFS